MKESRGYCKRQSSAESAKIDLAEGTLVIVSPELRRTLVVSVILQAVLARVLLRIVGRLHVQVVQGAGCGVIISQSVFLLFSAAVGLLIYYSKLDASNTLFRKQ